MSNSVSVIGGINFDVKGIPAGPLVSGTSNPGWVYTSAGGVGRNIAHSLALLDVPVRLFGVVGHDASGTHIVNELTLAGVNTEALRVLENQQTGIYLSILNETHDLSAAISAMDITEHVDIAYLTSYQSLIQQSCLVVVETNLQIDVLQYVLTLCGEVQIPCVVEPVSVEKAKKLRSIAARCTYVTPNTAELEALSQCHVTSDEDLPKACERIADKYTHILVTLGERGVYAYDAEQHSGRWYPTRKIDIVDATGAGDAFVAGMVCGIVRHSALDQSIQLGMATARMALQSEHTVNDNMTFEQCLTIATQARSEKSLRS